MRLHIESIAYGGDGVAHSPDGRVVFIPATCPGDVVEATVISEQSRYLRATLGEILEPSPDRVQPPCPYFGVCGGCQWQHVATQAQREAKTNAVRDALARIGSIGNPVVLDCIASDADYGYRNKIELHAASDHGRLVLGFARAGSSDVIAIAECMLLPKKVRALPRSLQGALRYLSGSSDLEISRVTIRAAARTNSLQIAIWTPPGAFPRHAAAKTIIDATGADSVVRVLSKKDEAVRKIVKVEILAGKPVWSERLGEHRMAVSAPSFFQVNTKAAEHLVSNVIESIACDGTDRVLDAYAGVGTFTVPLAQRAGEVAAIESSKYALGDLERNLEGVDGFVEIHPGDAGRIIGDLGRMDLVVVDPPRAGLGDQALVSVVAARPSKIAYVSCDPTTLARDASALLEAGYSLVRAQPVDLFPQTYHIETVAIFEKA